MNTLEEILLKYTEQSNDLFWTLDKEFKLIHANNAFKNLIKNISGRDLKIGESVIIKVFGEDYYQRWLNYYTRAFNNESFNIIENYIDPIHNSTIHGYTQFSPILDSKKNVIAVLCHTKEISEFINQYEHSNNLLNSSLDVICTIDAQGVFVYVNEASKKQWGYTPEELIGKSYLELIHKDDIEKTIEIAKAIAEGKSITTFENRYIRPDGEIAYNIWSAHWNEVSKLMHCTARNGSEKLKEEEIIKSSEMRFKALVQEGSDLIAILDTEGNYKYVSSTSSSILGIEPEYFIGKNAFDFIHPEDKDKTIASLLTISELKKVTTEPFRFKNKNNEWRWVETVLTDMFDNPAINGIVANSRDVTERVNADIEKNLLSKISIAFNEENVLENAIKKMCEAIAHFTQFSFAELWLPDIERLNLRMSYNVYVDEAGKEFYVNQKYFKSIPIDKGLPGFVWTNKCLEVWEQISNNKNFIRNRSAYASGINTVIGIPLTHNNDSVAVLVVGTTKSKNEVSTLTNILTKLDKHLGSEISRKKLESEFELMYKSVPDIICVLDKNGKIIKLNPSAEKLFEYEENELFNTSIVNILHPDDKNIVIKYLQNSEATSSVFSFKNRLISKSGKVIWLSWTCNLIIEEGIIYCTAKDFTHEKNLNDILDEAGKLARIGGWEYNIKTNTLYWSTMVHQMHETDPLVYIPSVEDGINYYREDFRELVSSQLEAAIKENIPFDFEAVLITAKGNELWVRSIGQAEFINNEAVRLYGSFQDIHKNKQLELRLAEILGSISDAFFALDSNWNFTYFNKEAENLLNKRAKDVIGKNIWELFPEAKNTLIVDVYEQVMATGKSMSTEYFFPGDNCWYDVNAYASLNGLSVYFKNINEKKKSEDALSKAYLEKTNIIESIADAFFTVDKNFTVTYWNKSAEILLNIKREELIGNNLWDKFPDAVNLPSFSNYNKVLETGQPITFEDYYGIWLEVNAYPSEEGLTVFFRDITHRKEADERLKKAYDERNQILESIGDAFFAVDNNWVVTYWNRVAEEVLFKKKEEIIGRNLWEEYDYILDSDFYRMYHKAKETGEIVSFEDKNPVLNKWFEVTAYPSANGLSVYFKDITIRKEADIKIREANERFQKVTEATNEAIWDWNLIDNSVYWGTGFNTLFGYDVERFNVSIESWTNHLHESEREKIYKSIQDFIKSNNSIYWEEEYRYKKADGTYADVVDRGVLIRNEKNEAVRMIGAMRDITYKNEYNRALENLNKELSQNVQKLKIANEELEQFAFITSHDLQEPLRMVSSFMDQLKRKYGDQLDEKAHQYIHFATDGAKRMKKIILDLLDYSRAGIHDDTLEEIKLQEILDDYKALRRKIIEEKSAHIVYKNLCAVKTFRVPLTQTLHSLIDNALKYSKDNLNPIIEINVEEDTDKWLVSVKDNGIGIDKKYFDKIFVIFQRLHNRDKYEGTGIGLSIVKKHIESWGGKIWLDSEPGNGSTFYFTILK